VSRVLGPVGTQSRRPRLGQFASSLSTLLSLIRPPLFPPRNRLLCGLIRRAADQAELGTDRHGTRHRCRTVGFGVPRTKATPPIIRQLGCQPVLASVRRRAGPALTSDASSGHFSFPTMLRPQVSCNPQATLLCRSAGIRTDKHHASKALDDECRRTLTPAGSRGRGAAAGM
jgi:hypothetical protein